MVFDARVAKQLEPSKSISIDGCPGLRLVGGLKSKTWTYRYRNQAGQLKQVKIGQWPTISMHEAISAWSQLKKQRDEGVDLAEVRKDKKKSLKAQAIKAPSAPGEYTVSLLVEDYVKGYLYDARKKAGARAGERALNNFLKLNPELADMPAALVERSHAFQSIEKMKDTPVMAHSVRGFLGAAWDYALDAGRLKGDVPNWWRSVMKGRLKSKGKIIGGEHQGQQRRFLTDAELAILLPWVRDNMNRNERDTVYLQLLTGVRGGEIYTMKRSHIKQEGDVLWWTIPKELTKNVNRELATDHRVPLFGTAREIVEARLKTSTGDKHLFLNRSGNPCNQHKFSTYLYNLQPYSAKTPQPGSSRKALPVTNWTGHNLRRTARTMLASLGCPSEIAEAILGHMAPEIVATYNAYSYDAERVVWLQKLGHKLESLGMPRLP